jgi:hypothetical protein
MFVNLQQHLQGITNAWFIVCNQDALTKDSTHSHIRAMDTRHSYNPGSTNAAMIKNARTLADGESGSAVLVRGPAPGRGGKPLK